MPQQPEIPVQNISPQSPHGSGIEPSQRAQRASQSVGVSSVSWAEKSLRQWAWIALSCIFFLALVFPARFVWHSFQNLDSAVTRRLAAPYWEVPSKVYARPLLLYPGLDIKEAGLLGQLARLDYRQVSGTVRVPGEYRYEPKSGRLEIYLRSFTYPAYKEEGKPVRLFLQANQVTRLENSQSHTQLSSIQLEPEVLATLSGPVWAERRIAGLHEVPSLLIKAIITAEDQRFFAHPGVDLRGILRAARANFQAGRIVQGGSTLTQQLVKNLFLTNERTLARKLLEITTAIVIENRYSKADILTHYMNEIYLGQRGTRGIVGVREAAYRYFGKEPQELSLGEIALLAGLVRAPNYYAPHKHRERALRRRNDILQKMLKLGYIRQQEYRAAVVERITLQALPVETNTAPYFIDFLKKERAAHHPTKVLATAGLQIFSSLDLRLQQMAQQALDTGLRTLEKKHPKLRRQDQAKQLQGCLIALQPQTGEIQAMVGGRDYRTSQFNRTTQAHRQLGSVFKPFVYLAALEQERQFQQGRFLPTTLVEDQTFTWHYNRESWTPANYENLYLGTVTLRQALEKSLNAATVRLAQEIGLGPIQQMAKTLGITSPLPLYPSLTLGAAEVTPLEVAQAFAVLANQGRKTVPTPVSAVTNRLKKTVESQRTRFEQVLSPQTAYLMTHLLQGVLDRGTGSGARKAGFTRPAAGKTGTTDDYADAWFVGYTPELVTVVWVGFDDPQETLALSGAQAALPIWTEFMKRATAGMPVRDFSPPPGVSLIAVDPSTGLLATPYCPTTVKEVFFAGREPVLPCHRHAPTVQTASLFGEDREQMAVEDRQDASDSVKWPEEEVQVAEEDRHGADELFAWPEEEVQVAGKNQQDADEPFAEAASLSGSFDYYRLARAAFARQHYQEALDLLTRAEFSFGNDVVEQRAVHNLRGMIYEDLGEPEKARLSYLRALNSSLGDISPSRGRSRLAQKGAEE